MPDFSSILYDVSERVATITLNRPERLNAWTPEMGDEIRHAVGIAGNDPLVRCIVVTGAGRGFCAGADMGILQKTVERGKGGGTTVNFPEDVRFPNAPGPEVEGLFPGRFTYLYSCPKPVIAAINGPCVGIGLIFTLYCDFRYAASDAVLWPNFASRGLVAEHGVAWVLPRLIGEAKALELLFTARKLSGEEAAPLGLVNAALPGEELLPRVYALAQHLASNVSPRSLAVMKRQVRRASHDGLTETIRIAVAEMAASFETDHFREGIRSHVERRPPQFPDL